MGGGVANKNQANAANAGATAQAQQAALLSKQQTDTANRLQPQADQYGEERQQLYNQLWGSPGATPDGSGSSGALNGFLDPNKLNVTAPTGPYAQINTRANEQTAKAGQDAVASIRQQAANRGFTGGSGLQSDQELKARLAAADSTGQNFSNATNASYQDALNNFWNAVQANQQGQSTAGQGQLNTQNLQQGYGQQAIGANQGAAQTYNQLYGVAGAYHPSAAGQIVGSALGAGGAIGGAALTGGASTAVKAAGTACVCGETRIAMFGGSYKRADEIQPGDQVRSRDGRADQVVGVDIETHAPCYLIATSDRRLLRASGSHTLERPEGGYIRVDQCMGALIGTEATGREWVVELSTIGSQPVYRIRLQRAHIYLSDGIWSLE